MQNACQILKRKNISQTGKTVFCKKQAVFALFLTESGQKTAKNEYFCCFFVKMSYQ